ncbi:hypothetical protein [Bacillus cereus]|nr:hypothetical protein [Bacillus cereus]
MIRVSFWKSLSLGLFFPEYDQDVTRRIFRVEELENVSTLISDSITRFHR